MTYDISPLLISLKTALFATLITFFIGVASAYWMLRYQGKWKSLIDGILISPLILPPTVVGFLLLLLFSKNSFIGKLLELLNISIIFTWYATVIAATVVAFPLMYKTALGAFAQVDSNLLQVARTLGASEWLIFWRISLPLASKGIVAGTTLAFARALGEFGATLMLAGNIPGQTQTMPMAIYFAVEAGAMTEAWIWMLVILSISILAIAIINLCQNIGEKQEQGSRTQQPKRQIQNLRALSKNSSQLLVDIQKKLADFELEVNFNQNTLPLGILGASGAGKSMILRCIAGIETPNFGRIVLNGRVLFDSETGINIPTCDRHVGFLLQNYALFPHLTVAQNIAFGLPKGTAKLRIKQQVAEQLTALQLQGIENRYPYQLSGGQQQRVALARVLASQPEILMLDEPFSALDTHLRSQLEKQLISTLAHYSGITLFVTHNLEEAYRVCRDLLVLEHGKTIASGTKYEIFERPNTFDVAKLTGCKNFSRAVIKGNQIIEAIDWGANLQVIEPISQQLSYVGIRAHQLSFTHNPNTENTFPCWLVQTSETPHRMTLYLKLHNPPTHANDYHLQAEVFKEKWAILKDRTFPWYVCLEPLRLMLLQD